MNAPVDWRRAWAHLDLDPADGPASACPHRTQATGFARAALMPYMAGMKCARCRDTGWVCEDHDDRPWGRNGPGACDCGAGAPCPNCNVPAPGTRPRLPPGFRVDVSVVDDK
jgi:hypothetical protein